MKRISLFALSLSIFTSAPLIAQSIQQPTAPPANTAHRAAAAVNYRSLTGSTKIDFKGTDFFPTAKGSASVANKKGAVAIDARFENLPPASQLGPQYLTYVLWSISPEGRAHNLGELVVDKQKSRLKATESLQAFGLMVTAEPYFAVSMPSSAMVLENDIGKDAKGKVTVVDAKYDLLQRANYPPPTADADKQALVMEKDVPPAVYQARNALRIAKEAGASTYASDTFSNAQKLLTEADDKKIPAKVRAVTAREVIQRAEDARLLTVQRMDADALSKERQAAQQQVTQAALNQARAETERAKAETERVKAEASRAQAEMAKSQADAARAAAEQAKNQATQEKMAALTQVEKAEAEKAELRAQLLKQLNSILQTQDSARGLIVNMSGVLFQTGKADLRPEAREKLAKVAGIVSAHPSLKLEVEGHTDNVGSADLNQTLSQKRAESAREYLVSQGVAAASITAKGFGSTAPKASNDTAKGRQENRRVELVVSGESLGAKAAQ